MNRDAKVTSPRVVKELLFAAYSMFADHRSFPSEAPSTTMPHLPMGSVMDTPGDSSSSTRDRRSRTFDAVASPSELGDDDPRQLFGSMSNPSSPRHVTQRARSTSPTSPLVSPRTVCLHAEEYRMRNFEPVFPVVKRGVNGESIKFFPPIAAQANHVEVVSMNRGTDFEAFRDLVDRIAATWTKDSSVSTVVVPMSWPEYTVLVTLWARCCAVFTWKVESYESTKNPTVKIVCAPEAFSAIASVLMFSDLLTKEWKRNKTDEYTRALMPLHNDDESSVVPAT